MASDPTPLLRVRLRADNEATFRDRVKKRFTGEFFVPYGKPIEPGTKVGLHVIHTTSDLYVKGEAIATPSERRGKKGLLLRWQKLADGSVPLPLGDEAPKPLVERDDKTPPPIPVRRRVPKRARTEPPPLPPPRMPKRKPVPEVKAVPEVKPPAETKSESETATEAETEAETATATETETEAEAKTEAESEPETETETEAKTEAESETETEPEPESETEADSSPSIPALFKTSQPIGIPTLDLDALERERTRPVERTGMGRGIKAVAALVALAVVAGGGWFAWKQLGGTDSAPAAPQLDPAVTAKLDAADSLLERGRIAGPGPSALSSLLAARELEPDNAAVTDRLRALADALAKLANQADSAGETDEAIAHLRAATRAVPDDAELRAALRRLQSKTKPD